MLFPYLTEVEIDGEAAALIHAVFGGPWHRRSPVDLDTIVYEHLSPRENLSFNDEAYLPLENGEIVLGKTLPIRGKILLNRVLKEEESGRARFTLAHELGHWVLHRKLFLAHRETLDLFAGTDTIDEEFAFVGLNRSVFPGSCRPEAVAREEWQANRFATALLVDPTVLREEFVARFDAPFIARSSREWRSRARTVRELASLVARGSVEGHPSLRHVFGLSIEAMAITLESRGYVVEDMPVL
jgi:hypothetical protein